MRKRIIFSVLLSMVVLPMLFSGTVDSYAELAARQQEAYLSHNGECVSFDGAIWIRNYGMKEYFLSPSSNEMGGSLRAIKESGLSSGGHKLIKLNLDESSRSELADYSIKVPADYPFSTINVMVPAFYLDQVRFEYTELAYDATAKPENSRPASRQLVYEETFEEDLGNEYAIDGWVEQPHIIIRNVCWGVLDCMAYEGSQSIWCATDLYDSGWYDDPPDPCSSYTNWMWTYFARVQTIDVTEIEEPVFEWWSNYGMNPGGDGDWCRVYIQDYPETDWILIAEYTSSSSWTDFQFELEDMSNVAYYFDFESDEMSTGAGVYLDNISIYNTIPNLTNGESTEVEYPYNYSTAEPHNLRFNYEVLNDSNVDVEDSFSAELVLSSDNDYTSTDDNYQLEEITFTQTLPSGESFTDELVVNLDTVTIPGIGNLPPGEYYVMFMIDMDDEVYEYDEEDNLVATTDALAFGSVNLTYGTCGYTYPSAANTTMLEISVEVINDGTEPTANDFEVGYMLSADDNFNTIDDNYTLGYTSVSGSMGAGTSFTDAFTIDLANTEVPADDYWVFIFVDSYNTVAESDENDNIWASGSEFDFEGAPYLEVEPLELNFSAEGGSQQVSVNSNTTWSVDNTTGWFSVTPITGEGDASLTVTVSENNVPDPRSGSFTVSGAGEIYTVTINQEAGSNLMYGDVNSSEVVDSYDAALVLQYVVEIPTGIDPFPEILADVDGDGDVAAFDAALILQYVVGVINEFPVENLRTERRE